MAIGTRERTTVPPAINAAAQHKHFRILVGTRHGVPVCISMSNGLRMHATMRVYAQQQSRTWHNSVCAHSLITYLRATAKVALRCGRRDCNATHPHTHTLSLFSFPKFEGTSLSLCFAFSLFFHTAKRSSDHQSSLCLCLSWISQG